MKERFWIFPKRHGVFYIQDSDTGKQISLRTKSREEAEKLLAAKIESTRQPALNLAIGKIYVSAHDPTLATRTWSDVMDYFCSQGRESTQKRRRTSVSHKCFDLIRNKQIIHTTADDFRAVLKKCGAFNNQVLRCLHNGAIGFGWLPWPLITAKQWPWKEAEEKRGITVEEHQKIIESEQNLERKLYYEVLWEIGASQTDGARLTAEDIDWERRVIAFKRLKTGEWCRPKIGQRLEAILKQLPPKGPLFPKISKIGDNHRSAEFWRRCRVAKVSGVSLHCYRYAWAERAAAAGYPIRYAQEALGHGSKAVHRAYAKRAVVEYPPLEEYEAQKNKNVVGIKFAGSDENAQPGVAVA